MKEELFDDVINSTLDQCLKTLVIKGKEYRRNNNPMHNFNVGVAVTGQTREEVIWGMALKHFISIQDMRNDVKNNNFPTRELVDEKYGDLINYLLLEKASIVDKIEKQCT